MVKKQVELARKIAIKAHKGQTRKFGDDEGLPYIVHPTRVAKNFKTNEILEAVAWLHDVVEDTEVTIEDLKEQGVSAEVILGIIGMTHEKGESYLNYILRVKENQFAFPVKIADIRDNLNSIKDGNMKNKYELALYILTHELL